jgi:cell division protein FtsL
MSTARALRTAAAEPDGLEPRRRDRRPPDLQVVEDARRHRGGVAFVVFLAGSALFASLFGLAVFHAMLVQGQSTIDSLDAQISEARSERDRLRLDLAEKEAPERILATALDELGMLPPDDVVVLDARHLEPGP